MEFLYHICASIASVMIGFLFARVDATWMIDWDVVSIVLAIICGLLVGVLHSIYRKSNEPVPLDTSYDNYPYY